MLVNRWLGLVIMAVTASRVFSNLGDEMGMRPKRRPSETDHRVTIDLSALRPSLPGLVLYKYGDLAPKLVQVDLSALNPRLQSHVIWPQFSEMELDERPFDLDNVDAIPYLTDEESFMSPKKMAKMTSDWLQGSENDIYDFVPDSQNTLMSLHGSLPLADEVIVPLDWEEGTDKKKRNVFLTRGWRAGGDKGNRGSSHTFPKARKGISSDVNGYYSKAGLTKQSYVKAKPRRETESEDSRRDLSRSQAGKKNNRGIPPSNVVVPQGRNGQEDVQQVRISSQESWSVPRQHWNVPHLFVNNWQ